MVVVLCCGCGSDPADSLLEPGTLAVVASADGQYISTATRSVMVPPGSTVRVGHDPGEMAENEEEFRARIEGYKSQAWMTLALIEKDRKAGPYRRKVGEPLSNFRDIKVTVESGPASGESGEITRKNLRPVK